MFGPAKPLRKISAYSPFVHCFSGVTAVSISQKKAEQKRGSGHSYIWTHFGLLSEGACYLAAPLC